MKKIKVWTSLSSICPSLNTQSRKLPFYLFFIFLRWDIFYTSKYLHWRKGNHLCVQVWWWAVGIRRGAGVHRLALESVHRGSTRRLQPPFPVIVCSTSSSTLHQVINRRFYCDPFQPNLISSTSICLGSSTLVTRSNTLPSRRTLKNSRLVCKKDDVHVCVMCLRAIMNYQVKT